MTRKLPNFVILATRFICVSCYLKLCLTLKDGLGGANTLNSAMGLVLL